MQKNGLSLSLVVAGFAVASLSFATGCSRAGVAAADAPSSSSDGDGKDDTFIQGGAVDDRDAAVGLVWIDGGGYCSGALIAPDVVLTAGHCVEGKVIAFFTGNGDGATTVGFEPPSELREHRVIDQLAHPSYAPSWACPNPSFDVALLRLETPIKRTKPLGIATTPPAIGASCTAIGYGVHNDAETGEATYAQKRRATEKILAIDETSILVGKGTGIVDHGDSGGPLVCKRQSEGSSKPQIVGVTSCGTVDSVAHTQAYYGRTDTIADWIDETIAAWQ